MLVGPLQLHCCAYTAPCSTLCHSPLTQPWLHCCRRCCETAGKQVEAKRAAAQQLQPDLKQQGPKFEATLLLSCLDCLSGLVEALGASSEPLVARFNVMALVLECCRDDNPGVGGPLAGVKRALAVAVCWGLSCGGACGAGCVSPVCHMILHHPAARSCSHAPRTHDQPRYHVQVRQSSFALVGDLARCCISHVGPVLGELLPLALANLEVAVVQDQANNSACNNACWSLGEMAIKVGEGRSWGGRTAVAGATACGRYGIMTSWFRTKGHRVCCHHSAPRAFCIASPSQQAPPPH